MPYAIVTLALMLGRSNGWVWWAASIYGTVTGLGMIALYVMVLFDESSTVALAFVFLPIYQLLGIVITSVAVFIAKFIHDHLQARRVIGRTRIS